VIQNVLIAPFPYKDAGRNDDILLTTSQGTSSSTALRHAQMIPGGRPMVSAIV